MGPLTFAEYDSPKIHFRGCYCLCVGNLIGGPSVRTERTAPGTPSDVDAEHTDVVNDVCDNALFVNGKVV